VLCIYPLYVVYLPGREVQLEAQERLHVWWQARKQVEIERVDTAPPILSVATASSAAVVPTPLVNHKVVTTKKHQGVDPLEKKPIWGN